MPPRKKRRLEDVVVGRQVRLEYNYGEGTDNIVWIGEIIAVNHAASKNDKKAVSVHFATADPGDREGYCSVRMREKEERASSSGSLPRHLVSHLPSWSYVTRSSRTRDGASSSLTKKMRTRPPARRTTRRRRAKPSQARPCLETINTFSEGKSRHFGRMGRRSGAPNVAGENDPLHLHFMLPVLLVPTTMSLLLSCRLTRLLSSCLDRRTPGL